MKITIKKPSQKQVWVSPNPTGWWRVHKPWAIRDSIHTQTKEEAVKRAKEIAKRHKAELIAQKKDGKIAMRNSYGRDPFPPRG